MALSVSDLLRLGLALLLHSCLDRSRVPNKELVHSPSHWTSNLYIFGSKTPFLLGNNLFGIVAFSSNIPSEKRCQAH